MGIGKSGTLKPDGEFIACNYGKHWTILRFIPNREKEKCMIFSSPMGRDLGIINGSCVAVEDWDNGITKEQYDWIVANKEEFDEEQLQCLSIVFDGLVEIK